MAYLADYEAQLLREAFRNLAPAPRPLVRRGLPTCRWFLASALQKAIRRSCVENASRLGLSLWAADAKYAWRRLRIIALEDVGNADVEATSLCVALSGKQALVRRFGELDLYLHLVRQLAAAPKSRYACDLVCYADLQIKSAAFTEGANWVQLAADRTRDTLTRAIAFRVLAGASYREGAIYRTVSRRSAASLHEVFRAIELPTPIAYLGLRGQDGYGLDAMTALVGDVARDCSSFVRRNESSVPERWIGGVLAASFCQYTRLGRAAYARWIDIDPQLRAHLPLRSVQVSRRVLGTLLFHREGSVLRDEFGWAGSDALRRCLEELELRKAGIEQWRALATYVDAHANRLNVVRREVARNAMADGVW